MKIRIFGSIQQTFFHFLDKKNSAPRPRAALWPQTGSIRRLVSKKVLWFKQTSRQKNRPLFEKAAKDTKKNRDTSANFFEFFFEKICRAGKNFEDFD
jgi:hypothetical protein